MKKALAGLLSVMTVLQGFVYAAPSAVAVEDASEQSITVTELYSDGDTVSEPVFTDEEWTGKVTGEGDDAVHNAHIYQINREKARADSIPYDSAENAVKAAKDYDKTLSPYYMKISGTKWKFALRNNNELFKADDTVNKFYTADYNDSAWNSIDVPSVWQLQNDENGNRYDDIRYTNTTMVWSGDAKGNPAAEAPLAPTVYNPVGLYRHEFEVPAEWSGKRVYINFEGVGSAMYLWVNGKAVGYSEDTHTAKEFDLTNYVIPGGTNMLAAKVIRWSDGSWLEDQDGFSLSGITRDVYLYCTDNVRLRDFSVVTDFDKTFTDSTMKVSAYVHNYNAADVSGYKVTVSLYDDETGLMTLAGNSSDAGTIGANGENEIKFEIPVSSPKIWTAETPNLYTMVITLSDSEGKAVSYDSYRIGFRKITYRKLADGTLVTAAECTGTQDTDWFFDNVRLNGKSLYIKGVNSQDFSADAGYAVDYATLEKYVLLMKQHNINALRMSHYPHNPYLYYLCDKYGLYVMDEANQEASGMYGSSLITSEFETSVIDRSDSMVYRDRNHASVIIWSYGNESGLGADGNGILYRMGDYLHKLDPTRPVQYEPFNAVIGTSGTTLRNFDIPEDKGGVDIKSGMYVHIDTMQKWLKNELANVSPYTPYIKGMPYILCEYDHAMGNSLGSLGDYWDFFRSNDQLQGGFIWDFVDQGVWTTDPKTGDRYIGYGGDFGDKPNDGNFCANGIISADGTLQPEIEEVERVQQNLLFEADDLAAGKISVENENIAVSASEYTFAWNITENGSVVQSGTLDTQSILPGKTAVVTIPYTYPENKDGCEYFLNIDAYRSLGKFSETSINETITEHARAQFALPTDADSLPGKAASDISNVTFKESSSQLIINGENFDVALDKATGRIVSYKLGGNEVLDGALSPNFYRAYIDNDIHKIADAETFRYNIDRESVKASAFEFSALEYGGKTKGVKVSTTLEYPSVSSSLDLTYYILGSGEIKIDFSFNAGVKYPPKLGSLLVLDKGYDTLSYFGRGPFENYSDRNRAADIGFYTTTVDDMLVDYIRPNDNGNRTDVRYAVINGADKEYGIIFAGEGNTLSVSASHYLPEGINKIRHLYQCTKLDSTVLNIDYKVEGVGSGSCFYDTLEQYKIPGGKHTWSYSIRPFKNSDAPTDSDVIKLANTAFSNVVPANTASLKVALAKTAEIQAAEETCTQSSYLAFDKALENANKIYANTENYTQKAIDNAVAALNNAMNALEEYVPGDVTYTQLRSDTLFGEGGYYGAEPNINGETYPFAFDYDNAIDCTKSVNFKGDSSSGYGGMDLGENGASVITKVAYVPVYHSKWSSINTRIIGTTFQGSNDKQNWTTFAEITKAATIGDDDTKETNVPGARVEITVSDDTPYRYVRFNSTKSNGSLYRVYFYTSHKEIDSTVFDAKLAEAKALSETLTGNAKTALDAAVSYCEAKAEKATQRESNIMCAYLDTAMNNTDKSTLDTMLEKAVTSSKYRSYGTSKQNVSMHRTAKNAEKLLSENASQTELNDAAMNIVSAWDGLKIAVSKAAGTTFGTGGKYGGKDGEEAYPNLFDGNLTNWADFADPGAGTAGVDLGQNSYASLVYARYYPRSEGTDAIDKRIIGEIFEVSNDGENWTPVGQITETAQKKWFKVYLDTSEYYRYFRINCPAKSYGSLCELEFYVCKLDTDYLSECVTAAKEALDGADAYKKPLLTQFISDAENIMSDLSGAAQSEINSLICDYLDIFEDNADRDALSTSIKAFEALDENAYGSESYINALDAYNSAFAVFTDTNSSSDELKNAKTALDEALAKLESKYEKLTSDTMFGNGGTWGNDSKESYPNAFDGNFTTNPVNFSATNNGTGTGGLDFGENNAQLVAAVRYIPLVSKWHGDVDRRFIGTLIQGSNDKENWTKLAEMTEPAKEGYVDENGKVYIAGETADEVPGVPVWLVIENPDYYRYVRFVSPENSYGSLYEVEFYKGSETTDKNYISKLVKQAKAITDADLGVYGELQTSISACETLINDQNASQHDVNTAAAGLKALIAKAESQKQAKDVLESAKTVNEELYTAKTYFAFEKAYENALADASDDNIAALTAAVNALEKLDERKLTSDTLFGTGGKYGDDNGKSYLLAFDGRLDTGYVNFSATNKGTGTGGLDFGESNTEFVVYVKYVPMIATWGSRVVGTLMQGSNDFETWTTFAKITEKAVVGDRTPDSTTPEVPAKQITLTADVLASYRYVRFSSPENSYGSLYEVEFYGVKADLTSLGEKTAEANALVSGGKYTDEQLVSLKAALEQASALGETSLQSKVNAVTKLLEKEIFSLTTGTLYFTQTLGASGEIAPINASKGETVRLPECTFTNIPDGYTFAGWSDGEYIYAAGTEYSATGTDTVFKAFWSTTVNATASSDTVKYLEGCFTVTFDKDILEESFVPENFGDAVSYCEYDKATSTFTGYVNYEKYKRGSTFTVSFSSLKGKDESISIGNTPKFTFKVESDPDFGSGNMIPNGSFDVPWDSNTQGGYIKKDPKNSDNYCLYIDPDTGGKGGQVYNYAKWDLKLDDNKRYYVEYDVMPDKLSSGADFASATVNSAVSTKKANWGEWVLNGVPAAKRGEWTHVEGLLVQKQDILGWFGIYANAINNTAVYFYLDNITLKEAYAVSFTDANGNTLTDKGYSFILPEGKTVTMPAITSAICGGDVSLYAWSNGKDTVLPGQKYTTDGTVTSFKPVLAPATDTEYSSIRVKNPAGIRFRSVVSGELREAVSSDGEVGFIVARADKLGAKALTFDFGTEDADYVKGISISEKQGKELFTYITDSNAYEIFAAVVGIPETKSALNSVLVVRPYAVLGDGSTVYGAEVRGSVYGVAKEYSETDAFKALPENDNTRLYIERIISAAEN